MDELHTFWYLSFVDLGRPKGERFLGVCIVEAPTLPLAVTLSHMLGCNPGGEVAALELTCTSINEGYINRLLTRQEALDFPLPVGLQQGKDTIVMPGVYEHDAN